MRNTAPVHSRFRMLAACRGSEYTEQFMETPQDYESVQCGHVSRESVYDKASVELDANTGHLAYINLSRVLIALIFSCNDNRFELRKQRSIHCKAI